MKLADGMIESFNFSYNDDKKDMDEIDTKVAFDLNKKCRINFIGHTIKISPEGRTQFHYLKIFEEFFED